MYNSSRSNGMERLKIRGGPGAANQFEEAVLCVPRHAAYFVAYGRKIYRQPKKKCSERAPRAGDAAQSAGNAQIERKEPSK